MNEPRIVTRAEPPIRSRIRRWLIFGGLVVVCWLGASWAVAYRLTHRVGRPFAEPAPDVSWARFESLRLSASDGLQIGAWYSAGRDDQPSVLFLHCNKASRQQGLTRVEMLAKRGCSLLLISLRAHGDSAGEYHDIGFSARKDVIAAVEYLERKRPVNPIVIMGSSLGSAAAIFASKDLGHRVHGYILESPYQDLRIAVRNRTENELPPVLRWVAYHGLLAVSPVVLPHLDQISPIEAIAGVPTDVPVMILAGDEDRQARLQEAEAILDRVKTHGELHVFPRAGHLGMLWKDPERYHGLVMRFLDRIRAPRF